MSKIKNLFSIDNLFVIVPILFILYLVIGNMGSIMERMGFETRTSIKAELVETKKNLNLALIQIGSLETIIKNGKAVCDLKEEVVDDYKKKNDTIDKIIDGVDLDNYLDNKRKKEEVIEKEEGVRENSIPIEIVSIHEVYNKLYGS